MNFIDFINSKNQHLPRLSNESGAAGEIAVVSFSANWVPRPKGKELQVLLQELERAGTPIKRSSFDAIYLPDTVSVDFFSDQWVRKVLPDMVFVEIKTTKKVNVKPNFVGFFFAITANEIEAAEILGARHRVILYNHITGEKKLTSIPEIVTNAKSKTWQVSIQL
jgi:hypothetical protein